MGGVLQYKWEAYCDAKGRGTDNVSLSWERRHTGSTAVQIGGVLQYKLEVYFDTFLRSRWRLGFLTSFWQHYLPHSQLWTVTILLPMVMEACKRGLKPQKVRENRAKILPGKSVFSRAFWGQSGPIPLHLARGQSKNCTERGRFFVYCLIEAFSRAKPPFAKPPFRFPQFLPAFQDFLHTSPKNIVQMGPHCNLKNTWLASCMIPYHSKQWGNLIRRCLTWPDIHELPTLMVPFSPLGRFEDQTQAMSFCHVLLLVQLRNLAGLAMR